MPYKKYPLIRKSGIRTESIHDKKFRLGVSEFGRPVYSETGITHFFSSLPKTGAAQTLTSFADCVREARKVEAPLILCLDESALIAGLNPIIVDLMERGWISALCVSWSFLVRDFEIALIGRTDPEDWGNNVFGVTEETGVLLASALKDGRHQEVGGGESVGLFMSQSQFPFSAFSLFFNAYKLNIPVTLHPVLGGDESQLHPHFDSAIMSIMAERDFTLLSSILAQKSGMRVWVHAAREEHLAKVLENGLKFCSAQGISTPRLLYGLMGERPEKQSEVFDHQAGQGDATVFRIPGAIELMFPLFSALLLCSEGGSGNDGRGENQR